MWVCARNVPSCLAVPVARAQRMLYPFSSILASYIFDFVYHPSSTRCLLSRRFLAVTLASCLEEDFTHILNVRIHICRHTTHKYMLTCLRA